jgi:hypothetical protein
MKQVMIIVAAVKHNIVYVGVRTVRMALLREGGCDE